MEFSRRKFNIIVIFTVCLMCVVLVFSTVDFSATTLNDIENTIADSDSDYDTEQDSEGEIENNPENDPDNSGNMSLAPEFTAKTKWNALNYALANLEEYDYKMTMSQSVQGTAVGGFGGTQSVAKTLYRVSGKHYSKVVSGGVGPSFTDYAFVDATSVITNRNKSNNVTTSYNGYASKFGLTPEALSYKINPTTATIDKFDYNHPTNRKRYVLTVTLKPQGYAQYLKSIEVTAGSGSNPQMTSAIILTINIDMKYCRITSITAQEKYDINQMGFRVSCVSKVSYNFKYGNYSGDATFGEIKSVLGI